MQKQTDIYDLAIIGAGAAGLFTCALIELIRQDRLEEALTRLYVEPEMKVAWQSVAEQVALYRNLKIILIEGQKEAGRKLLLTGGGRCNLASNLPMNKLLSNYHEALNFLRPTWQYFSPHLLRSLLFSMGISSYWDEQNRLYPSSNSAKEVRDKLIAFASQNENLTIVYENQIQSIKTTGQNALSFLLNSQHRQFNAKRLIIASGGYSVPSTGSNGELANFLAKSNTFPCTLLAPKAALAPLLWQGTTPFPFKDLAGISLSNVELFLECQAPEEIRKQFQRRFARHLKFSGCGDLLITQKGFSGPAIFNLARFFCHEAAYNKLSINFLNDASMKTLKALLATGVNTRSLQTVRTFLQANCNLPNRLLNKLLEHKPHYAQMPLYALKANEQQAVINLFTWTTNNFVTGSLKQAQASCGGIALNCLNPKTLALKSCPDCFLVGEIMNVDGCCGGFNLLHAFATSSLVVRNLSKNC